jgi:predicted  nucleic acid-binding Zn-ribbon protein
LIASALRRRRRRGRGGLSFRTRWTGELDSKIDWLQARIATHETKYDEAGRERERADAELRALQEERDRLKKQIGRTSKQRQVATMQTLRSKRT